MTAAMQECITNCENCHRICLQTVGHCLSRGGAHASPDHIRLLQDCAQICAASADFMIRESPHHAAVCGVCADICDACARDCEALGDDPAMRDCAEACRRCAASCREMAGTVAAGVEGAV
jgi:hypothetical protein